MKVDRVRQKTVVQQVMDQIKDLIASGQLKPHDRMPSETELAQMFGIGRSTIREAIKAFQYLGVLEATPRKGTVVCDYANISVEALTWSILLRRNDLYELIDLREVIEERTLRVLTERHASDPGPVAGTIHDLELQLALMKDAVGRSSLDDIADADYEFHRQIIQSSGNTLFSSIYNTLRAFLHEEMRKTNLSGAARSVLVDEHADILAGIRSGDSRQSIAAFRRHISATREQMRLSISAGDQPPVPPEADS